MSRRKLGIFKEYSDDSASIECKGYDIKTLEHALEEAKVDLDIWSV